jgi:hypothetical protein
VGDLLVECVDVGGGAQAGLAPGVLAQCGGETLLEVLDASVKPGGAFVGGEEVGLQRGSGDRRSGALAGGRWFGGQGVGGVQPRYGQKPPSVDRGVSFYCSDEVSALVVRAAVEAEHREAVPP